MSLRATRSNLRPKNKLLEFASSPLAYRKDTSPVRSGRQKHPRHTKLMSALAQTFVLTNHNYGTQNRRFIDLLDVQRHAQCATCRCFSADFKKWKTFDDLRDRRLFAVVVHESEKGGVPGNFLVLEPASKNKVGLLSG